MWFTSQYALWYPALGRLLFGKSTNFSLAESSDGRELNAIQFCWKQLNMNKKDNEKF